MSVFDRIARLFENYTPEQISERVRTGIVGEAYATEIIKGTEPQCHISNVVVPMNDGAGHWKETDHVVLWGGTVFIVEVKNDKGLLRWAGEEDSDLVQFKTGNYGEAIAPKPARNPALQAKRFIRSAKSYLAANADRRFQALRFQPVGVFTRAANLECIHSLEKGLIYVDELPAYFALHKNQRFANRASRWLVQGLAQLPRLDVIHDSQGQTHLGVFEDSRLEYRAINGEWFCCDWMDIDWVQIQPARGLFSEQDEMVLHLKNGERYEQTFRHGIVRLCTLEGQRKALKLRGLQYLIPSPVRLEIGTK